jgi:tetratricopeptide (TPR) repeat protein
VAPRAGLARRAPGAGGVDVGAVHAMRARFAFAQGDPRGARALAAPIEADPRACEAARVSAAVALAEALAVLGCRDEAIAVARRWEHAAPRHLAAAQALAHWLAGSFAAATHHAERAYAAASDSQGSAVSALLLGHAWLSRGDTDAALRWFRESSALLRGADPIGMHPAALAGIAQAAAQAGDVPRAQAALAALPPGATGRGFGEELVLARAWTAHATGDTTQALALATAALHDAHARGAHGLAAHLRRELARLHKGSDPFRFARAAGRSDKAV